MDELANSVLATLKKSSASAEAKVTAINSLKSTIKHQRIPENAQAITLECLRLAITSQASSSLVAAGLSSLGHLVKRLTLQDQTAALFSQRVNLLHILLERLGDQKETQRAATTQLFCDLWPVKPIEVEKVIREGAIEGSNVRAKIAGMQWVTKMHEEQSLQFRSFVPPMVECLEDADGMVRESAKLNIVELFRSARDSAKADLKRQLLAHNVRKSIAEHILSQLAVPIPAELDFNSSVASSARPQTPQLDLRAPNPTEPSLPPSAEITSIEPLYVHAQRELEDMFRAMHPCFEGRESEDNWKARDNNVLKMRRFLKGNAPQDHHVFFVAEMKNMLDGILKVANSLRTTTSTNGCLLAQELARTLGSAIDPMAEILLRGFEKMCAATKHIAAQNGNATIDIILANASYNVRHVQHVFAATGDKNVQPRQFAAGWLKTILKKQSHNKSHFEHSGGLDLAEKSIKKGLTDANPKVRELMRGTYWAFAQTWPTKAEAIMDTLDAKSKQLLEKDPSNPNFSQVQSSFTSSVGPSGSLNPRAPVAARVSLKDAIAAQRNAAKRMPDRPTSAMSSFTPSRPAPSSASRGTSKPVTQARVVSGAPSHGSVRSTASTTSTTSTGQGSLMAAPVRRPRKADMPRPATADPYGRRNDMHEDTPPRSPVTSPRQGPKFSASGKAGSHVKSKSTTTIGAVLSNSATSSKGPSPRASPVKSKTKTALPGPHISSHSRSDSMITSPGSREDNSTVMLTDGKASQKGQVFSRSRNNENDRPNSGHSSLLGTVEEDNFTLVIPERSKYAIISPPHQPHSGHELGQVKQEPDEHAHDALSVYEDAASEDIVVSREMVTVVLEEKPVNEQNVLHQAPPETLAISPTSSPPQPPRPEDQNQQRPRTASPTKRNNDAYGSTSPVKRNTTTASQSESPAIDRAEVLKARRLLASGTERVRTRTLDAHGYRRLQDLIKTHVQTPDLKFGPLLNALVESLTALATPGDTNGKTYGNGVGLKGQALGAIKAVVSLYARRDEEIRHMVPSVLIGFANAAGTWEAERIGSALELEKAADEVVTKAASMDSDSDEAQFLLDNCANAVAEYVERSTLSTTKGSKGQNKAAALAITILARLIPRIILGRRSRNDTMPEVLRKRLARLAVRSLSDLDPDIRRKGVELALELYAAFPSPEFDGTEDKTSPSVQGKQEFWTLLKPAGEQSCNLLAYYLARRGRVGPPSMS